MCVRLCGDAGAGDAAERAGDAEVYQELAEWGAGPRAAQYLVLAGKARAITRGRLNVSARTSGRWRSRCCGTG